jgi:hypothetical protein
MLRSIPAMLGPFALADAEALKQSFSQAGFKEIKIEILQITFGFDSPESYTNIHQQVTAPIHAILANHPEEANNRAWSSSPKASGSMLTLRAESTWITKFSV